MNGSNLGNSIGRRGVRAPGDAITNLGVEEESLTLGGSSFAVPFVTGAIALLWSAFPFATAAQIRLAVTQASTPRRASVVPPLLDASAADDVAKRIAPLVKGDLLAPWYREGLEVRNEAPIITSDGRSLRPDRVVFDNGVVRVLDIKTGMPHIGHHDQVLSYMRLLNELGNERVEGALLYVRDGSVQTVQA